MIKVSDIVKIIEDFAPPSLAYEWDNTGLISGDRDKSVKRVFVTLDITKETVDMAVREGVDMIISHHPMLFKGIQRIDYTHGEGYILKELIKNDIALYASHTSTDCTKGGINDVFAQKLGIENPVAIEKNPEYDGCGLGRIGKVQKTTLREFAEFTKAQLNTPFVRVCGDLDMEIGTVAVCGGGGSDLIDTVIALGGDVFVTADLKYHISAEAVENGLAIIDAGHYPTEVYAQEIFAELLKDTGVEIIKSNHKDVFKVI